MASGDQPFDRDNLGSIAFTAPVGNGFTIKDTGARESFESGMVRDTEEGKLDYTLIFDGPMLERWAEHLTKGAQKYAARNWMKATGMAEYERFRRSFLRHMVAYLRGERDEDHAAAMFFNLNGMEYVLSQQPKEVEAKQPDAIVPIHLETGEQRLAREQAVRELRYVEQPPPGYRDASSAPSRVGPPWPQNAAGGDDDGYHSA